MMPYLAFMGHIVLVIFHLTTDFFRGNIFLLVFYEKTIDIPDIRS